jgi:hypothetical protein
MASTLLNEQGYNRDWIERQLAHGERNSVRAAYNYAEYLPERRRMMQEWADYLDRLRESEPSKNRAFASSLEGTKHHDSVVTG